MFLEGVQSWVSVLFMESVQSWIMAPKLQEDWFGTKDEIGSSNVHLEAPIYLDLVPQECNPGHGTKIARGLDWYTKVSA